MFLKKLQIQNFRNHANTSLSFKHRLIFFIGDNGEGKTNLLEAISFLAYTKSFRENNEQEILCWNQNNFFLRGEFETNQETMLLEFGYECHPQKRKRIKVNQEVIKKQSDALGIFQCVVFAPPDLQIIDFGHEVRRKFLDTFLCSFDREYTDSLAKYQKAIKQRNAVLKKNHFDKHEIVIWNNILLQENEIIVQKRYNEIEHLSKKFQTNLQLLSSGNDPFSFTYAPNVSTKEKYAEKLQANLQKDLALGYTTSGAHRDKIVIGDQDRDLVHFGSQGQKRSTVIALKTAVFQRIFELTGQKPVLLIDDVIRELDVKRREYFVDLISQCGQVFFTTTDLEGIQDYLGNLTVEKEVYKIQEGKAERWQID